MKERDRIMDKSRYKLNIIKEFYKSNKSIRRFCKDNGLKKSTLSIWLKQFEIGGYEGLIEKSKKPRTIKETPKWAQNIIVELNQKMGLGSKNISRTLEPLYKISHTSVLSILRRNGIVIEKEKKRWRAFRAPYKNHTWQVDFLGPYTTLVGEISILVMLDDYSRYAKAKIVKRNGTTEDVTEFLSKLIQELGKPYRILTDNGTQFRKMFDKWCKRQGIKHHKARVRHPQTLGKVEAVNKTLGNNFKLDFASVEEGQIKLDAFMEWRNQLHFHSVIESTPASAYGVQRDKLDVLRYVADKLDLPMLKSRLNDCPISGFT